MNFNVNTGSSQAQVSVLDAGTYNRADVSSADLRSLYAWGKQTWGVK